MQIGVLKEIKDKENRVALTPMGARQLVDAGHVVCLQAGAGLGSGFSDDAYLSTGVSLVSAEEAWASELVLKIKEPLPQEYTYLKANMLFTFLHLAGVDPALTEALLAAGTTDIAYETVEDDSIALPLLKPMTEIG